MSEEENTEEVVEEVEKPTEEQVEETPKPQQKSRFAWSGNAGNTPLSR